MLETFDQVCHRLEIDLIVIRELSGSYYSGKVYDHVTYRNDVIGILEHGQVPRDNSHSKLFQLCAFSRASYQGSDIMADFDQSSAKMFADESSGSGDEKT